MDLRASLERKKFGLAVKRILDILFSAAGLILLSPFFVCVGIAVKRDSKGPVFFKQTRVGRDGVPFAILKFRTMTVHEGGSELTVGADNRITKTGAWLRKYKLDEFPQLVNVLRGEMSLVGPRPEVPRYVAYYTEEEHGVLLMRPGITEEASILFRNESDELGKAPDPERYYVEEIMPKKLAIGLEYVRHWSLARDAKILWKTFVRVFVK